jgi:hypothetical protein
MRTPAVISVTTLVTATLAAGCGGSSSSGTGGTGSTPLPSAVPGAATAVTTSWETFFNAKTPRAVAAGYLEDGAALGRAMNFAARLQRKEHLTENAKVTKVVFTNATTATVTYNLVGTPLQGATGVAVYQTGKWLVSKNTFCGLVELGAPGKAIPGCS